MLTRLRLKNMKPWHEQLWDPGLDLAPITLLLGPNSAGKTSLLQAPLILKQTFESPDRTLDLNMGGQSTDLVDLGSYASVVHGHDLKRDTCWRHRTISREQSTSAPMLDVRSNQSAHWPSLLTP